MLSDLVRRAQTGDADAYTDLVRKFQDAVYATAYQAVLDADAARDLAQDTFVRAYEHLRSLRDPGAFPGWLIRICRNLTASWLRRPERQWVALDGIDVPAPDVAPLVASRDLVSRALSALPEENRLALSLSVVNGYTYDEVAELTGVPVTTVKGRVDRAKRKLAAEVLTMVEDTLKSEAPAPEFTLETVRKSLGRARELADEQQLREAKVVADEALQALSGLEGDEGERRELRLQGLSVVRRSIFHSDNRRWAEATRESLSLHEEQGDVGAIAYQLASLAWHDRSLTQTERDALALRATEMQRQAGLWREAGSGLFTHGWGLAFRGRWDEAQDIVRQAREALDHVPYGPDHALLDAMDELLRLAGGQPDIERRVYWSTTCEMLRVEGDRLRHCGQPGSSGPGGVFEDKTKCAGGFSGVWYAKWVPHTGPEVGHAEELDTFSYTGNPTRTRVWIETDDASVATPAGCYEGCRLVRLSVAESPQDAETESRERTLNRIWCGERWLWLARGIGPVGYRHEQANGMVEHAVLSRFECPEQREEWVPLVVGTRWEYAPAAPPEGFEVHNVYRLTHVDEAGVWYFPHTILAQRPEP